MTVRDETLAFLREGYGFVGRRIAAARAEDLGRDLFETRLLGSPAVCLSGPEAARAFYEPGRLTRVGALPPTALTLLQDRGSVATLDGAAHRARKAMFLGMMRPGRYDGLVERAGDEWRAAAGRWRLRPTVRLRDAAADVLCRAVSGWAGLPLGEEQAAPRTAELLAMIDGAGSIGLRQARGQLLRRRAERWARAAIEAQRAGRLGAPEESPVAVLAGHRDEGTGDRLDPGVAAVELLNVIRPTVAVANFVAFAALYMTQAPEAADRLRSGGAAETERFVQEVRRLAPFFPVVAGRVREPFAWRGRRFPRGERVILDLYGTNRDPRSWEGPDRFEPERFRGWEGDPFTLVPQGGGGHADGHRCAGEWITIDLLRQAVDFLARESAWSVPAQDLTVDLSRMPARPASGMVIADLRPVAAS